MAGEPSRQSVEAWRYDLPDKERADSLTPPSTPSFPQPYPQPTGARLRARQSLLDELLPVPAHDPVRSGTSVDALGRAARRAASLGIIAVFLLSVLFLAATESTDGRRGLSRIYSGQVEIMDVSTPDTSTTMSETIETDEDDVNTSDPDSVDPDDTEDASSKQQDFEQYKMLSVVGSSSVDVSSTGRRVIFIGDVHGSYQPLLRLMDALQYNAVNDTLIHVGDLVAKGSMNAQVLTFMREGNIRGVRGNHDQPWRAWMEWAGGSDWKDWLETLPGGQKAARKALKKIGKRFPKDWEWQGEHWKIARDLHEEDYDYLLNLPLTLHLPSLHSIVVHAGLLPADPLVSSSDGSQPLVEASLHANDKTPTGRTGEELSILSTVPQNRVPWNLINMRGVYETGSLAGAVTKSSKKGTPWSDVWNREMKRCTGAGMWWAAGMGEYTTEKVDEEQAGIEAQEDAEEDETGESRAKRAGAPATGKSLQCSPVTVIYGHAAGRNLDIKPFSKGIDTGCVYGRQLTALVLGDTAGLTGDAVRVDDNPGVLVSIACEKGGG